MKIEEQIKFSLDLIDLLDLSILMGVKLEWDEAVDWYHTFIDGRRERE